MKDILDEREMETQHMGETRGAADHDHDMVHELSKRLDALWRYDQYIANAERDVELCEFWRKLKSQEKDNISTLKEFIATHCARGCF